jgi:tetratricopeptide repeat protein 21B
VQVLSAYIQMASKSRGDIEAAVGQLLDLANNDPNNVPVLMALAHGFLLLKQTAKARNQLKVRSSHDGPHCWLGA